MLELSRSDWKMRHKNCYLYIFFCHVCNKIVLKSRGDGLKHNTCSLDCRDKGKGGYKSKVFEHYHGMKTRCYNPNYHNYSRYGGRGIKMCDDWLNDFFVFEAWALANGWTKGLQIDRIDNDGDYKPSNCRFVDSKTNMRNSSNTKLDIKKVLEIKRQLAAGRLGKDISYNFNISPITISQIKTGKRWSDVK